MTSGESNRDDRKVLDAYRAAADVLGERAQEDTRAAILAAAARSVQAQPQDAQGGAASQRAAGVSARRASVASITRRPLALAASVLVGAVAVLLATQTQREQEVAERQQQARVAEPVRPKRDTQAPAAPAASPPAARQPSVLAVAPPPAAPRPGRAEERRASERRTDGAARGENGSGKERAFAGDETMAKRVPAPAVEGLASTESSVGSARSAGTDRANTQVANDAAATRSAAPAGAALREKVLEADRAQVAARPAAAPEAAAIAAAPAAPPASAEKTETTQAVPPPATEPAPGALRLAKPDTLAIGKRRESAGVLEDKVAGGEEASKAAALGALTKAIEDDPRRWLARIVELRKIGRDEQADRELARLRERYPNQTIPQTALHRAGTR